MELQNIWGDMGLEAASLVLGCQRQLESPHHEQRPPKSSCR